MTAPLVFMDTETTGLALDDDIWEFAAIRREPDGTERRVHLFIEHDTDKCVRLPRAFREDHRKRWAAANEDQVVAPAAAARIIAELFTDRPHVVVAVPNFDTERLALLLRYAGYEPGWHYHLIDVENLAVGYLHGVASVYAPARSDIPALPWNSNALSRAVGIEPPGEGVRHTAMGDAEWAMRLYDRITGDAE